MNVRVPWRVVVNECVYACMVAGTVVRDKSREHGIVRFGNEVSRGESNGGILPAGLSAHVGILGGKVREMRKGARDLDMR